MTDTEYTPSVGEAREAYANGVWRLDPNMAVRRAEFDRMIAALVERTRAEEREKAARIAESLDFGPAPAFSRASAHRWGALQAAARIREGR